MAPKQRDYIEELRAINNVAYRELAEYMNKRLIFTNKTIYEYVPIDGIKQGYEHLIPVIQELRERGFFDGN